MLYQATRNKKQRKNDKVDKGRLERIKKSEPTEFVVIFGDTESMICRFG
jgi:hypothetical protein